MVTMAVTASKAPSCDARISSRGRAPLAAVCSVFVVMAYAPITHAIDWRFEPTVSASSIYTDNLRQSANNPEDALILTVTPGFNLRSEGSRRMQGALQYGVTEAARFGDRTSNAINHRLNATGTAELVEDFLFIDSNARISQELISLFGSPADASINGGNRTNVGSYSISPYVRKRFGTFANAQARYTTSGVIFGSDTASDLTSNGVSAGLTSGTRFNDLNWGLNYSIRKTDSRNEGENTFENATATLGYALTRKFRIFGTVGQDWNDFLSASDTSGSSYSVGFGWSPTRRTSIEASAGERFFGRTFSLAGRHQTRQTRWTLRYTEDVSDVSRLATNFNDFQGGVLNSCPAGVGAGLPPNPTVGDLISAGCDIDLFFGTSIVNGVFISKLFSAGVAWDLSARTVVSLNLSDLTREFQFGVQSEDRVQRGVGAVSYRLSPQTTATGSLSLSRSKEDGSQTGGASREDDLISLNFGLDHRFAATLNGALTYSHIKRDSNAASSDYDENRLTATVNMRF